MTPNRLVLSILAAALLWGTECGHAQPATDRHDFAKALDAAPRAADWRLKLDRFAEFAAAACLDGTSEPACACLETFIRRNLRSDRAGPVVDAAALPVLETAADALFFLEYYPALTAAGTRPLAPDLVRWLLRNAARLTQVADLLDPRDDAPGVARVLQVLYQHDPKGRDDWFALILAMAVVWDQPRPELPLQAKPLPYAADLGARYDYFRNLYGKGKAKLPYAKLTPQALTFVVDTPVPVSELEWAQKNVRAGLPGWADMYFSVRYDESRLRVDRLDWPHGPYTLAAIRSRGGICTDQAYFATLTARAWGIPALIFIGEGRRGGHAWFAYMKSEKQWEMDVARFAYDKYVTGYTLDPQTQVQLTDHQLEFTCNRAFGLPAYRTATRLLKLAALLCQTDTPDTAYALAQEARRLVPLAEEAWAIQQKILADRDDVQRILVLLQEKAEAFRNYPDFLASIRQQQAILLQATGKDARATQTVKNAARQLQKAGRDDLASQFSTQEAWNLAERGERGTARRKLEAWLKENRREGQKVLPVVDEYLTLTRETRQTAEAVQFLDGYLSSMYRATRADAPLPEEALEFLARLVQAYENNGDVRKAEKLTNRIRGKTRKP